MSVFYSKWIIGYLRYLKIISDVPEQPICGSDGVRRVVFLGGGKAGIHGSLHPARPRRQALGTIQARNFDLLPNEQLNGPFASLIKFVRGGSSCEYFVVF